MREQELANLLEGTADAAFAVLSDGRIRVWNAAAAVLFGYSAEEALRRNCYELLHGCGELGTVVCRAHCDVWACAERQEKAPSFDLEVTAGNGERRWVNMSSVAYRNPRSGQKLMVHLARDITPQRQRDQLVHQVLAITRKLVVLEPDAEPVLAPVGPLSRRQIEILRCLAQGKDSAAVAQELGLSPQSLRNHLHRINQTLRTHSRLAAVAQAQRRHLI